jgi:hypothetical protein
MKPNNTATHTVPTARMNKAETNRKNALKSTGPTTRPGKNHSRRNALKHGLYSKELLVSEADTPEYQEMCVNIKTQLQPETYLQELGSDYCAVCYWRVKMGARLEHRQFAHQLQDIQHENSQRETPEVDTGFERWYLSSRADTRAGIRALEGAKTEFDAGGYLREETRNFLRRSFGPELLPLLDEWTPPMNTDAMLLAEHLIKHRDTFGDAKHKFDEMSAPEVTKLVVDPRQSRHMVIKLLEQQRKFLMDLLAITERNSLDGTRDAILSLDFNPRLLSDANRELRRALDGYLFLRANGL